MYKHYSTFALSSELSSAIALTTSLSSYHRLLEVVEICICNNYILNLRMEVLALDTYIARLSSMNTLIDISV